MTRRDWMVGAAGLLGATAALGDSRRAASPSLRLGPELPPEMCCWFWSEAEFRPDGWQQFLDTVAEHSPFRLLTTTIRAHAEVADPSVREHVGAVARYARKRGLGIVMDLDVRLAREAFRHRYPDEMQEMLRVRTWKASGDTTRCQIASEEPGDHYTFLTTPYVSLAGRLERVYAYRAADGHASDLLDVTDACVDREETAAAVSVSVPTRALAGRTHVAAVCVFTHLAADVFGPHLLSYQREILESYSGMPLAGACKDEWGFPPCFDGNPDHNDFWYSLAMAAEYARRSGGRDLVRDTLLMHLGEVGRERERSEAIDTYQEMCWARNVEVECDYYSAVKRVFGPEAVVATHPTWWPLPDAREIKKNGLSWWGAKRDLAQTDEIAPYCCRTALAKKWRSPAWWNMFYAPTVPPYEREVWASALAGGRITYHPPWPAELPLDQAALFREPLLTAECRVRLLDAIGCGPLDCPVAVVFGHRTAMNWTEPGFADVGVALAEDLWRAGYPADLIPSTEVRGGALCVDAEGALRYGPQSYAVAILWQTDRDDDELAPILGRDGPRTTRVLRASQATREQAVSETVAHLEGSGIARQLAAVTIPEWNLTLTEPPVDGEARFLDGTHLIVGASASPAGDPIRLEREFGGIPVRARAEGLLALRADASGELVALAAGGLAEFSGGGLDLRFAAPLDVALRRERDGRWQGWAQDWSRERQGELPAKLNGQRVRWTLLARPAPRDM